MKIFTSVPATPAKPDCPVCGNNMKVTTIYRPEVFEFSYYCSNCDKGFN